MRAPDFRAVFKAAATACLFGWPLRTISLMFLLIVFLDVPFL